MSRLRLEEPRRERSCWKEPSSVPVMLEAALLEEGRRMEAVQQPASATAGTQTIQGFIICCSGAVVSVWVTIRLLTVDSGRFASLPSVPTGERIHDSCGD